MADTGDDNSNRNMMRLGVAAINALNVTMSRVFPAAGGTSPSASAGSATLPENPIGFIVVTLPDGTAAKVPYYG